MVDSASQSMNQIRQADHPEAEIGDGNRDIKASSETGRGSSLKMSQRKKWSLLAVFSLSLIIDQWCLAAFYIFAKFISEDLSISITQQSWIITSYTVTFASTLLFWGRISDLYSASRVFNSGLLALALLSLIISFLPEKYSFFVFRGLSGIAGATSVPSAFRLIVSIFEPHELHKAFACYGTSGALANTTGNLLAGVFQLIPSRGQMIAWRWFFRLIAAILFPVGLGSWFWIPSVQGKEADVKDKKSRLDLIGCAIMLVAILLLILSLTLGASSGFNKPSFIVPFIISLILFPLLWIYESRLPEEKAILPISIWKHQNFTLYLLLGLLGYHWWSTNFLPFLERWMSPPRSEKPIIAALRVLPEGFFPALISLITTFWSKPFNYPRTVVGTGCTLGVVGYILFVFSDNQVGRNYWKFLFPAFIFGPTGMMLVFNLNNAGAMMSVPPSIGGVAGALLQVSYQTGTAIAFSVQAGLFTIHEGNLQNFDNVKASFYFEMGWVALWGIGFVCLYKPVKKGGEDEEPKAVVVH
ncbi:uncharacterized protein L199_006697 [Kwoniella botswanensis]|uniref:uncharacterized protein n=1 Tax=Kwoniella botswanensis TaxID=1268659 RepID=UPI00315D726E